MSLTTTTFKPAEFRLDRRTNEGKTLHRIISKYSNDYIVETGYYTKDHPWKKGETVSIEAVRLTLKDGIADEWRSKAVEVVESTPTDSYRINDYDQPYLVLFTSAEFTIADPLRNFGVTALVTIKGQAETFEESVIDDDAGELHYSIRRDDSLFLVIAKHIYGELSAFLSKGERRYGQDGALKYVTDRVESLQVEKVEREQRQAVIDGVKAKGVTNWNEGQHISNIQKLLSDIESRKENAPTSSSQLSQSVFDPYLEGLARQFLKLVETTTWEQDHWDRDACRLLTAYEALAYVVTKSITSWTHTADIVPVIRSRFIDAFDGR